MTLSSTCTSYPRCTARSAASSPIGPAPVTSTRRGDQAARPPIRSMWSHAFATTLAGSTSTAASPSDAGTETAAPAGSVYRSAAKPSRALMPCSV